MRAERSADAMFRKPRARWLTWLMAKRPTRVWPERRRRWFRSGKVG